jgi:hypothetical protein
VSFQAFEAIINGLAAVLVPFLAVFDREALDELLDYSPSMAGSFYDAVESN